MGILQHSRQRHRVRVQRWIVAAACLLLPLSMAAGGFWPSPRTAGLSPVLNLEGAWTDQENRTVQVPFTDLDARRMLVQRSFDLGNFDQLPDSLYLYFEGLAWTAEIYLNKRLIAVSEDPFGEHLYMVEKGLLLPAGNQLELRLDREGPDRKYYPSHFVGVFRQAALLRADAGASMPRPLRHASGAELRKVLVVAPWTPENGHLHDTASILPLLDGLFSVPPGITISFPYRPSSHALDIVARMRVPVAPFGHVSDSIAFYNAYPISLAPQPLITPFWRDDSRRPLPSYGKFQSQAQVVAPQVLPLDKVALTVLVMLPILLLLLLKLLSPRIFDALPEYLTRSKIYLELISSNKFLKDEQRLVMNLYRITFLALMVSLYLYYLSVTGGWERLNVLSQRSLLYQVYNGSDYSLYVIFAQVMAIAGGLTLLKYFLLNFVAGVYRVHNFASTVQNLDIFASFPLNLLATVPGAVVFFLSAEAGAVVVVVWYCLILLHWLRRLYLLYSGLTRLYPLSVSLKILYICTLEISPWIFLL